MSATKRGPGRPRGSKYSEKLAPVRMTGDELRTLEAAAESQGLPVSEYVRRACGYCAALRVPLAHVTTGPLPGGVE